MFKEHANHIITFVQSCERECVYICKVFEVGLKEEMLVANCATY